MMADMMYTSQAGRKEWGGGREGKREGGRKEERRMGGKERKKKGGREDTDVQFMIK